MELLFIVEFYWKVVTTLETSRSQIPPVNRFTLPGRIAPAFQRKKAALS
jgi:hypothetical protein